MPLDMTPYTGSEPFIFVSYSHRDADRVLPAVRRLIAAGFRIWYDDAIELGREWDNDIALHVRDCSVFIPFLTENYMASVNCKNELRYALSKSCKCLAVYLEEVSFENDPGIEMYINVNQNIMAQHLSEEAFFLRLAKVPLLQTCRKKPQPVPAQPQPAPEQQVSRMLDQTASEVSGQGNRHLQQQTAQYTPPEQQQFTQQQTRQPQQFGQPQQFAQPQQTRQPFNQQTAQAAQPAQYGQPYAQPQAGYPQPNAQTAPNAAKASRQGGSVPDAGGLVWLLNVLGLLYSILLTIGVRSSLKTDDHYGLTVAIAIFHSIPALIGVLMIRVSESRHPVPRTHNDAGLLWRYAVTGFNTLFPLLLIGHGSTYTWQTVSNLVIAPVVWLLIRKGSMLGQLAGRHMILTLSAFFWFLVTAVVSVSVSMPGWYRVGETLQTLAVCIFSVSVMISGIGLLKRREYGGSSKKAITARVVALGLLAALTALCLIGDIALLRG